MAKPQPQVKTKKPILKTLLPVTNVLIILALIAFGGYYFKKYNDLKRVPNDQQAVLKDQKQKTITAVGKLYDLPKDEDPQFAVVTDNKAAKEKNGAFFEKAENNDVTLIYVKAKVAILYRPSQSRIINVSSVVIEANKANVKVLGASRTDTEQKLTTNFKDDVSLIAGGDAKSTPGGIVVVDLSGQKADLAKKIADGIGGAVGSLPEGEDKPTGVDILVVLPPPPAPAPTE